MRGDEELVHAWRAGDTGAGQELFERYYDAVARFFGNKTADGGVDLVQRTFLACLEGAERLREAASFRSYLFAIANNLLRKHYSDGARGRAIDFGVTSLHDLSPTPSRIVVDRQEHRLLLEALRGLPIDHQVVLEFHYWEELTVVEIAGILAIPAGTVKTRLRRGRELLLDRLRELTPALLTTTVSDLDGWARDVRAGLGGDLPRQVV